MPKTFVMGHSSHTIEETFVPKGLKLSFYTPPGHSLGHFQALQIAAGGDWPSVEVFDDTTPVPNYSFSSLEDWEIMTDLTVVLGNEGARALYIGAELDEEVPLCKSPDECDAETGHRCDGLFTKLVTEYADATEFHFLSCRGDQDYQLLPGETTPEVANLLTRVENHWREITADPTLVNTQRFFDEYNGLDTLQQTQLYSRGPTRKRLEWYWALVRIAQARERGANAGVELLRYHRSQSDEVQTSLMENRYVIAEFNSGEATIAVLIGDDEPAKQRTWSGLTEEDRYNVMALDARGSVLAWLAQSERGWLKGFRIGRPGRNEPGSDVGVLDAHNGAVLAGLDSGVQCAFVQQEDLLFVGDDPSWWKYRAYIQRLDGSDKGSLVARLCKDERGKIDTLFVPQVKDPANFVTALKRAVAATNGLEIVAATFGQTEVRL